MTSDDIMPVEFSTRAKIEFLVACIVVAIVAVNGYSHYEDFIDNEKLELETSLSNQRTSVAKSATTTVPILVYHKIGKTDLIPLSKDRMPIRKFNVQEDVFDAQMAYIIERGYTPLTIRDLIKDEQSGTLPDKPIAVTFDDGWRSQYENALPILTKYQIPATFYIYTGVIGSNAYMTWDNLQNLVSLNMEIGDHTKSHPRLARIDPHRWDEEMLQSKIILERHLHTPVTDFAYPYGNYNSAVIDAVKKYGYTSARTSNKGIYNDFKDIDQLSVIYAPSDLQTLKDILSN